MKKPTMHETNRGRAFVISMIGGLTLLILAVTVFAVANQARSVSEQAEQAVRITEDLRVVSIARAELLIASRVASLSPGDTDALLASLDSQAAALDAVEQNFDERTSTEILSAFSAYRVVAAEQAALLLGTATPEQAVNAELATGEAYETLALALRDEQVAARDRLTADNDVMNVISTVATFIVAFVVPSAALYIFEALRRTPRRARELELQYETSSANAHAMAGAVAKEAVQLRNIIDGLPSELRNDDLQRSVLRFEHVAALNGAVRTLHNVDVDVNDIVMETTRSIGHPVDITTGEAGDAVVHGDRDQIALIITELLHNAITHGSTPVALDVSTEPQHVLISVTDAGLGLPDVIEDAVIHDNEYATRGNLLSGIYGFGLLASREAAESLGGRLRYHREDSETTLIVELPTRYVEPMKPSEITLHQALEGRSAA